MPIIPFLGVSLGLNEFQVGIVLSIFSMCQLFASPITGKLSDRYGRKPLLLFSQTSTLIGFFLLGIANNVWILVAARLVDGLLGSNMTVAQAYISDVTNPKHRTKTFGYSSAVFGAALVFGPVIGGILSTINYSVPMFFAAGVSLLSIVLVLLFLPESLNKKERENKINFKFGNIIPIRETKRFFKSAKIRGTLVVFFIYTLAFFLFITTFALFAKNQINVTVQELSFYMAWIGILRVIFQGALINPLLKKLGENTTLKLGVFAMIFTMTFLIFSNSYWIVYIPLTFLAFGSGVIRPILTSKLTKTVKREETGSLLGVNNALISIGQIITPILGGLILLFLPSQMLPLFSAVVFALIFLVWRWAFVKPFQSEKQQSLESKEQIINL
jgi:DHA1 family tetracycline resistance protein-like MFS transporter